MPDSTSPSTRIADAFARLSESAKNINAVSEELSRPIRQLERALEHLRLGVACWTTFSEFDDGCEFHREYVGYAQVRGVWCIAIQTSDGDTGNPEQSKDQTWTFDESPRHLRVKAVDKLPDLIEALVRAADATTERLKKKVAPTKDLAAAVAGIKAAHKTEAR